MFNVLGKMFGSEKALDGIVKGVTKGLDALVYTDEEKANDAAAARTEARGMVIKWMEATQGQNLARRLLAVMITFIWLFMYVAAMVGSIIAVWVKETEAWHESAQIIGDYAEQMNGAMMLILGFYFAAPHIGSIVKGALDKFGGNTGGKK